MPDSESPAITDNNGIPVGSENIGAENAEDANSVDETLVSAETDAELLTSERENLNDQPPAADSNLLPVVGLGGSAGSISALQEFFGRIPTDLGVAYVVVLHLSPDYESQLPQVLQACTRMPIVQVQDEVPVQANHVYVIPPAHHLIMSDGVIRLSQPQQTPGKRVAVDLFFRTLATTHRSKAVAIVLSGADADGTIGIKRVKEHGGLTVAQDPEEAEYESMPRAAIETGMVDWILSVEQMTVKLAEWISNERRMHLPPAEAQRGAAVEVAPGAELDELALREVLAFLQTCTGHDFSHYKRATVLRRIMRRLQVNSLENIPEYANFLRTHPGEAGALLQDLLISVTNFFRDPEAFRALETHILRLFRDKNSGEPVRIWVPGCATGEEAYSLTMLFTEQAEMLEAPPEIQIFATDLDEQSLRLARDGIYPASITADVSPKRLRRFFVHDRGRYRIKKEIRERIMFATHNLLSDSPFSRLDLVSCRNLLIYFNRLAQDRVLDVFDFALKPGGLLFLGSSEMAEDNALFAVVDKKHRIYKRQAIARRQFQLSHLAPPSLPRFVDLAYPPRSIPALPMVKGSEEEPSLSFGELHLRLLEQTAPPSVLVNANCEIVHLSEHTGQFLRFAGGEMSTNLLSVVHPALRLELLAALLRAVQHGEDVKVPAISAEIEGTVRRISMRVRPLRETGSGNGLNNFALVIFDEQSDDGKTSPRTPDEAAQSLETELQQLKAYLRSSVEQYETSAKELKASNEELQALNEEQRTATEELETSREEIQATNEELITVNQELKLKIEELSRANSDLQNLMASTDIATIFLDRDLRIKLYTPPALEIINFIPTDYGRPLAHLRNRFAGEDFINDAESVLRSLAPLEREVKTTEGKWFLLRVSPYRTAEDRIDGLVLAFVNITRRKAAEISLQQARDELEARVMERTAELEQVNASLEQEAAARLRIEQARERLLQRVVNVQEEERRRISRELHDSMGQQLTALLMGLQMLPEWPEPGPRAPSYPQQIEKLREMATELMQQVQRLAWELRPAALDNLGLQAALQQYVETWGEQYGTPVRFIAHGQTEAERLPEQIETTLYRVVQEALTNAQRHAKAKNVSVLLEREPTTVTAIIEDDGQGFAIGKTSDNSERLLPRNLGLLGMQERMELVNGTLTIESTPGQGTTIYARVPLQCQDTP